MKLISRDATKKINSRSKGITLSYFYFVLNAILSIVLSSFILRSVGKTDNGVYHSMTAFMTYLVLLEFGMSTIMARNISLLRKKESSADEINKNVSTIWTTTIILSGLMFLLLLTFYFLIPNIYSNSLTESQIVLGKRIFVFAGLNLIFTFLTSTLNGLILAYEKYVFEKFIQLIRLILRAGLIVAVLSIKSSIILVPIIDFGLGLAVFVLTIIYCLARFKAKLNFKYFDKRIVRSFIPLAIAMLIQALVNTANTVVDKFLISIMMTPEDVSVYSITMMVFNMFSSIGTLPNTLFIPSIAKNTTKNLSNFEFTKTLVQPCRLNVIFSGLAGFGFLLVGRSFIELVYGVDYVQSWTYCIIILVPLFFYLTDAIMIHVLTVLNKRQIFAYISLIATGLNVLMTIFAIKWIGMLGASIATAISIIIQVISLNIYYKKKIGISVIFLYKEAFKGIIPSLFISFAFALPIQHRMPSPLLKLIVGVVVFVLFFSFSFKFFGANRAEKEKIDMIIGKIKRRGNAGGNK